MVKVIIVVVVVVAVVVAVAPLFLILSLPQNANEQARPSSACTQRDTMHRVGGRRGVASAGHNAYSEIKRSY